MSPAFPPGSCGLCNGTGILTCGNVQRSDEPKKPTMTQPTKPSAGAVRAAEKIIFDYEIPCPNWSNAVIQVAHS
ncbi:hypothetical protein LCGC14_1938400, partial [marine sediment metagenome]